MRRLRTAAKKILWRWENGSRKTGRPFFLSERDALKVDEMVEELFNWEHSQKFMGDNGASFASRFLALEKELKELTEIYQQYKLRVAKIERATGVWFPGLGYAGPTIAGQDEEGNYYQIVDGIVEKG